MPDWVTHLGTTYLATRAAVQFKPSWGLKLDARYLLMGALLPDATRFTIILVDILDWPAIATFTYFIPFHSLVIVALLAGALALVMPLSGDDSGWAFGLIMIGAALHFLMDDLEGWVGCGSTTFYPFYFGKPVIGWNSEGGFATFLLIVSFLGIALALYQRRHWPVLRLRLTRWRLATATGLVVAALIIPFLFQEWLITQNAYYLGFVTNPSNYEGQLVELCFSEVITASPPTVEEFDRAFVLQTTSGYSQGEWVSLRGIYNQGKIEPTVVIRHRGFSDLRLSFIAAVAFLFLLFDFRLWLKKFNLRNRKEAI